MDVEELRRTYLPENVRILLVGESAPVGGKFFYCDSAMTTFTSRAFENAYGATFKSNADFLRFFQSKGCYLDDLSLIPVNGMGDAERERALQDSVQSLAQRIEEMKPEVVVAVLRKIEPYVRQAVQFAGQPIVFRSLPFPCQGHQNKFIAGMEAILRRQFLSSPEAPGYADDVVLDLKALAQAVGKSVPFVLTLQKKYGLTPCTEFSRGHAALVSKLVYLSTCSVPGKDIKELLKSERRLLELLKADSLHDRPDWFESLCTMKSSPTRLLLSGFDIGYALSDNMVQAGLDFSERDKELFEDQEMGADALVGLNLYAEILEKVRGKVKHELPVMEEALHWCREIS